MKTAASPPATTWLEGRRLRAWQLKQQGWTQRDIAKALGVTEGAVCQWMKRAREGGAEALRHQPPPGPEPRLTSSSVPRYRVFLPKVPRLTAFVGDLWTTKRVASVIEREFGVRYHPAHVSRLLRELGWSVAEASPEGYPAGRGRHRDLAEGALARSQKGAEQEGRTIVWVDESGFYLLPAVARTYAPRGQTPILRLPLTRDHLSAISAITPQGKLYLMVQETAYHSEDVVRFLKHLLRQIPGKLLVIWDGAQIHKAQPIKDFLAKGGAKRILLERLPGYAPELNPDDGIWNYLKHVELPNVCCHDLPELRRELRLATARLRHKRNIIQACFTQRGYQL